jgi:integrase
MIMLTEVALKNLKPKEKSYKMADSGGLYIEVTPAGGKSWKLKYRHLGKEKKLTIGAYPIVGLKMAREKALEAKELLAQGIDPSAAKKEVKAHSIEQANKQHETEKQALNFETLFYQWYDTRLHDWSDSHANKVTQRYNNHIAPHIGSSVAKDIKPIQVIAMLKVLDDANKTHMRMKVKGIVSMVFKYGVGFGLLETDPTASVPDNIFKAHVTQHYATVTDPAAIREVLAKLAECNDNGSICRALTLAPYVFLRPSELVGLRWEEIDFEAKLIRIKASRMKMKQDHLIPMSRQVVAVLEAQLVHKVGDYVFVNYATYAPISPESLRQRIRRLGIDKETLTPHGFRHMASTRLNEMGFSSDAIEKQLSHTEGNAVRRAYNHAEYLPERTRMMQEWADFLTDLVQ